VGAGPVEVQLGSSTDSGSPEARHTYAEACLLDVTKTVARRFRQ
jgi:hypothetical protein